VSRPALLLAVLVLSRTAAGQAPRRIPIRAVTPVAATTVVFGLVEQVREVAGGRLLVNDEGNRELALFDSTLKQRTALADSLGTSSMYPRFGKLVPYLGDSSFFYISDSRSLQLVDPQGKFMRVLALPRPQDFNSFTSGRPVGIDDRGRLVYQGRAGFRVPPSCRLPGEPEPPIPPRRAQDMKLPTDTVPIIRADFETRGADTVGRAKVVEAGLSFPTLTTDAQCHVTAAKVRVNPSVPATDSWVVTSRGSIAIVRGFDYHIDWIDSDGTRRSSAKLPYDWRRLTDADKQVKIDSAKRIIDSLTAIGGFRLKACGRGFSFNTAPPDSKDGDVMIMGGGGGAGLGGVAGGGRGAAVGGGADAPVRPPECQTVVVAPEFAPFDSMADFIAPIRESAARADLDGNVWILPTTSASANGGLLYDVVNPAGELVERVQLPGGCDIAGFGRGGVLYLTRGDYKTGFLIQKVRVAR